MKKLLLAGGLIAMTAVSLAVAPGAAAATDQVCIHLIQSVQAVPNLQALPDQSLLWQCTFIPG